jgi:hypothetical protein
MGALYTESTPTLEAIYKRDEYYKRTEHKQQQRLPRLRHTKERCHKNKETEQKQKTISTHSHILPRVCPVTNVCTYLLITWDYIHLWSYHTIYCTTWCTTTPPTPFVQWLLRNKNHDLTTHLVCMFRVVGLYFRCSTLNSTFVYLRKFTTDSYQTIGTQPSIQ